MTLTKLCQQDGMFMLTLPDDIVAQAGWRVGMKLDVTAIDDAVNIKPVCRVPRGRKTVAQLLAGIDQEDISRLSPARSPSDDAPASD